MVPKGQARNQINIFYCKKYSSEIIKEIDHKRIRELKKLLLNPIEKIEKMKFMTLCSYDYELNPAFIEYSLSKRVANLRIDSMRSGSLMVESRLGSVFQNFNHKNY